MTFLKLRNIVLLVLTCLLPIINADPIRSSATAELSSAGSSGRKLINIQQQFTRDYSNQGQDTTDPNVILDLLATTVEPQLSTHEDLSTVQEEQILDDRKPTMNSVLQVATEPTFQSSPVETSTPEALLFYPPLPVDQLKYRPATHYGPPTESYRSTAGQGKMKTSNRPFGSSDASRLRQLGFPPISNTRENLGQQVNWAAKIGRSHGSFHDFLSI